MEESVQERIVRVADLVPLGSLQPAIYLVRHLRRYQLLALLLLQLFFFLFKLSFHYSIQSSGEIISGAINDEIRASVELRGKLIQYSRPLIELFLRRRPH